MKIRLLAITGLVMAACLWTSAGSDIEAAQTAVQAGEKRQASYDSSLTTSVMAQLLPEPTSEVAVPTARAGEKRQVSYGGVSFTYDASLATSVTAQFIPEPIAGTDLPIWAALPEHIMFEFQGYSVPPMRKPVIYIFPIRGDYKSLVPTEPRDFWLPEIEKLRTLRSQKPDVRSLTAELHSDPLPDGMPWKVLPYLPPINAVVFPLAKLQYVQFRNGSGIRYLGYFTQEVSLPTREVALYTFQGLTNDGKYYIAAVIPAYPAAPPSTPDSYTDIDEFEEQLRRVMEELDRTDDSAYTPDLNKLDQLIRSLTVNPRSVGALPGMPRTGDGTGGNGFFGMVLLVITLIVAAGGLTMKLMKLLIYKWRLP